MRILRPNWVLVTSAVALGATLAHAAGPVAGTQPPPPAAGGFQPPPPGIKPPAPVVPPTSGIGTTGTGTTTTTAPTPPALIALGPTGGSFNDLTGQFATLNVAGTAVAPNPFFQSLGTNGRACASCHHVDQGWSLTPSGIQTAFAKTQGLDPIFRTVDGSNSPEAAVATLADRQKAYSMLLNRGVFRIGLPIPTKGQFTLSAVDDPYDYATSLELSLFRRPLPATNLPFLSTVMWDGRETATGATVNTDLHAQAIDATVGHAEAVGAPASGVVDQIVAFEIASATAQSFDKKAGLLTANGGLGGPAALVKQPFHIGINDPAAAGFNPHAMSIYDAWAPSSAATTTAQQSIARGEQIFNNRKFTVMHVAGLNDVTGQPAIVATCTSCHNTPNVGNHSTAAFFDLGLTDTVRRTPDMPLYTLKNKTTGAIRETTDPGRAMVTGNWADIGKFKVPTLRGLAARAPYFHDGSAQDVNAVIGFYDRRFNIGFTPQERADLAAFLNSL